MPYIGEDQRFKGMMLLIKVMVTANKWNGLDQNLLQQHSNKSN